MELKSCLLTGLLVSAGGVAAQNQATGLHSLFVAAGKQFFGTATDTNLFNDAQYLAIANDRNEFGLWVPENSQKWQPTEPTQGKFAFTNPDLVAQGSRTNGQIFRCHTLTWHSQLPDFVQTTVWTRQALTAAIQAHIANVVGHFKGQCYSWDVVNEALNDNGTFRNDVFFQTMGTEYIPISFQAAAEADPAAKLYYNDFNLETSPAKADGAVGIVKMLQAAGIRIDGLGFQAHLNVGITPNQTSLVSTLNRFTSMGLEVAYTELDIAHMKLPTDDAALQQQANDYVNVVSSCLAVAQCVGIVVWEFTDKYSWIPSTFPGKGDACLYDANFNKKPAYTAVLNLISAAASGQIINGTLPGGTVPGGGLQPGGTVPGGGLQPGGTVPGGGLQPGVPVSTPAVSVGSQPAATAGAIGAQGGTDGGSYGGSSGGAYGGSGGGAVSGSSDGAFGGIVGETNGGSGDGAFGGIVNGANGGSSDGAFGGTSGGISASGSQVSGNDGSMDPTSQEATNGGSTVVGSNGPFGSLLLLALGSLSFVILL